MDSLGFEFRAGSRLGGDLRADARECREHCSSGGQTFRHILAVISLGTAMVTISGCAAPADDDVIVAEEEAVTTVEETRAVDVTPPTADEVLAKLATCRKVSASPYAKDVGGSSNIDICGTTNAVFFKADMDIDCDGKQTSVCNRSADASYQSSTAAVDSRGRALDASVLPYIVVPGVSSRWSYRNAGIKMGSIAAVIYNGKIEYGIVGDVGPVSILGEASYAMAKRLGINPNPSHGGTASGVTYVIFKDAKSPKNEDLAAAVRLGQDRARRLVDGT